MNRNPFLYQILFVFVLVATVSIDAVSQARVFLHGANITLANGAYIVVDNSSPNAITRTSGSIISEGQNNYIQWNIRNSSGTFVVPWGYNGEFIPLTFTKSQGSSNGYFLLSTYHTTWNNQLALPSGVTNFNSESGTDKSIFSVDRFWGIEARGYGSNPKLSGVTFSYASDEFNVPNAIEVEGQLQAQRWNDVAKTWDDFIGVSTSNTVGNTVTLDVVDPTNFFSNWILCYRPEKYWISTTENSWSNSQQWSWRNGGAPGAGVPSKYDIVYFDGASGSVLFDTDIAISSLSVGSQYSGTIKQDSYSLTVSGDASFSGGTFEGGDENIIVGGELNLSGSNFKSTSAQLDVKENVTFTAGSFNHHSGTISFSGAGEQRLISTPGAMDVNHINISNTSAIGLSIEGKVNFSGVLTLADNVTLDADGAANDAVLTLTSSADDVVNDGAIDRLGIGASIIGNMTVQRHMAIEGINNGRIYRYISSPVTNASVSDIQKEISVTGSFTGTSICSGCGSAQSMFSYNEKEIGDLNKNGVANWDDGYVDFPQNSNTELLMPGIGYALFVRGNTMQSARWDVRGTINSGNNEPIKLPVTYTASGKAINDGWNLVGNPYPSTIDWNSSSGWAKENIETTIYVRNNGGSVQQYATWNGVTGTNGGSRYIAIGQAFWVKATNTGVPKLTANENVKSPRATTSFFRTDGPDDLLRITLVQGSTQDDAVIHFREDATENFDGSADAMKLTNAGFNLSTLLSDGTSVAINSMPSLRCETQIPLMIANAVAGNYILRFSEFDSFKESVSILLADKFTNTVVNIRTQGDYAFSVSADPRSFGAERFVVSFQHEPVRSDFTILSNSICESTDASIAIQNAQEGITYRLKMADVVFAEAVAGETDLSLNIAANKLSYGENTLSLYASREGCSESVTRDVTIKLLHKTSPPSVIAGKFCNEGSVTLSASSETAGTEFNWYSDATSTSTITDVHDSKFITPILSTSTSFYVSAVANGTCESDRVAVTAERVKVIPVTLTNQDAVLTSSYDQGNQWYFDEKIIDGAVGQTLRMGQSGNYKVITTVDGCSTAAEFTFVITAVEGTSEMQINLYPNPVKDIVKIEVPDIGLDSQVSIFGVAGNHITTLMLQRANGKRSATYDMSQLQSGLYIAKIASPGKVYTVKVIKE